MKNKTKINEPVYLLIHSDNRKELKTMAEIEKTQPIELVTELKQYGYAIMASTTMPEVFKVVSYQVGFESVDSYGKVTWVTRSTLTGCCDEVRNRVGNLVVGEGYVSNDGVVKLAGLRVSLDGQSRRTQLPLSWAIESLAAKQLRYEALQATQLELKAQLAKNEAEIEEIIGQLDNAIRAEWEAKNNKTITEGMAKATKDINDVKAEFETMMDRDGKVQLIDPCEAHRQALKQLATPQRAQIIRKRKTDYEKAIEAGGVRIQ